MFADLCRPLPGRWGASYGCRAATLASGVARTAALVTRSCCRSSSREWRAITYRQQRWVRGTCDDEWFQRTCGAEANTKTMPQPVADSLYMTSCMTLLSEISRKSL